MRLRWRSFRLRTNWSNSSLKSCQLRPTIQGSSQAKYCWIWLLPQLQSSSSRPKPLLLWSMSLIFLGKPAGNRHEWLPRLNPDLPSRLLSSWKTHRLNVYGLVARSRRLPRKAGSCCVASSCRRARRLASSSKRPASWRIGGGSMMEVVSVSCSWA